MKKLLPILAVMALSLVGLSINPPNAAAEGKLVCGLRDRGCFAHYGDTSIYYHPASGGVKVKGEIRKTWGKTGWENGPLGYPTSNEFCGLRDRGCGTRFEKNGAIMYWTSATGSHFIRGLIGEKYGAMGWERSAFGYPRTNEFCGLRGGGCGQHFQHRNGSIYWSPPTGAHPVEGKIKAHWAGMGWERSALGYPTGGEYRRDGLVLQNFQGGWLAWNGTSVYGEGWPDPRSKNAPEQYGTAQPGERAHTRELVRR